MIRALIFDLDDTLYPEKDFVLSGYRAVARYVADGGGCNFDRAFAVMAAALQAQGRHGAFPALLAQFPGRPIPMDELVDVYRRHIPEISLFPGYRALLQEFARHYRLGVITDGLPAVQERKVRALGLEGILDKIVYSWEYGQDREKPHPHSFSLMMESLDTEPASSLFVGDNPDKDGRGALNAGMSYAQVRPPLLQDGGSRSFLIDTLFQLPPILRQLS
jgi:putative hydrolase of the HAD superfamily